MKGNFGLYVVPNGGATEVLKIDYNSGKTWRLFSGEWVKILDR